MRARACVPLRATQCECMPSVCVRARACVGVCVCVLCMCVCACGHAHRISWTHLTSIIARLVACPSDPKASPAAASASALQPAQRRQHALSPVSDSDPTSFASALQPAAQRDSMLHLALCLAPLPFLSSLWYRCQFAESVTCCIVYQNI